MSSATLPRIIQGGMGVAVSNWRLARAVASAGQLGVVSGTALDTVLVRRLQDGDEGGHVRRALAHLPLPGVAAGVLERWFKPEGRADGEPYQLLPMYRRAVSTMRDQVTIAANFVEVFLAKEGHGGRVGINLLTKVQMPTLPSLYGAMLAGVDVVLMGAGIPREIPQLIRALAAGRVGRIPVDVSGGTEHHYVEADPVALLGDDLPQLTRPNFLAIISLDQLASYLHRDPEIRPDGFIVERPPAGGHSAPPRGKMVLDEHGAPVYGARDEADLTKMAAIGLPFWMAGAYGTSERVAAAVAAGAQGVQVGTVFALSSDSGLTDEARSLLLGRLRDGELVVRNDPRASPTGFPFKVISVDGTVSEEAVYESRPRLCDLSYLRQAYQREDGSIGYRCAAEPVHMFVKKGGSVDDTVGRKCLCNGLVATIGMAQHRKDGYVEDRIMTLGEDLDGPRDLIARHPQGWTAAQALAYLQEGLPSRT